tara:strand:- start:7216 stop:8376 length:1161 start_codon:yes stop_codon:yes gene_type:complete
MNSKHYSHFLKNAKEQNRLYFTAHSHQFWPDVTRDAVIECWEDASKFVDDKWKKIFSEVIPEAQNWVKKHLSLQDSNQVVFGQNTHELVYRLLSGLNWNRPLRVLTTDSEFHSFNRQAKRLSEVFSISFDCIPQEPFETLEKRLLNAIEQHSYDACYLSHVFYNSGKILPWEFVAQHFTKRFPNAPFILDGYHSFFAIPIDLSDLGNLIYFTAGGYKYAQSGEGVCFLTVPQVSTLNPTQTGWMAGINELEGAPQSQVSFSKDASRFLGSTFDPTSLYRFRSVMKLFHENQWTIEKIDHYIRSLQKEFITLLPQSGTFSRETLLSDQLSKIGHFFSFYCSDPKKTDVWLRSKGIIGDYRGEIFRIGFAPYHTDKDIQEFFDRLILH